MTIFFTAIAMVLALGSSVTAAQRFGRPQPSSVLPAPVEEQTTGPLFRKSGIKEEELGEGRPLSPSRVDRIPTEPVPFSPPASVFPLEKEKRLELGKPAEDQPGLRAEALPGPRLEGEPSLPVLETLPKKTPEPSLLEKIGPGTSPRRAASLRLAEEGQKLLELGEYEKALDRFEKTLAVDSTNPYSRYYLALAHHYLGHYRQSFNFVDVAESFLSAEPLWLARVFVLKGKNFRAVGSFERADDSFTRALKLDAENRVAFEALTQLGSEETRRP